MNLYNRLCGLKFRVEDSLWRRRGRSMYRAAGVQTRAMLARGARMITHANKNGRLVPIEPTLLLVIKPGDASVAQYMPTFVQASHYPPHRDYVVGEIGGVGRYRVVVDEEHAGPPKVYAQGERFVEVAALRRA